MQLAKAQEIAIEVLNDLRAYCSKIAIAGSIRRKKPEVKDIEIVCIPQLPIGFSRIVNQWEKVKGDPTGKYTQRILPQGIKLDLFMAERDNWGNIFLIRTGDARFNIKLMIEIRRVGLKQKGGYLWRGEEKIICREEKDIFALLNLLYLKPELRIG